ncbi:hypothetical protein niasHT_035621 [Heterodera trifolii]|uniref:Serine/threonine-protein kinase haspin C-terminal domain-containing protein n=1 Tax=Heterodera trifolii TaxID=157864 RepID=A0ABD2IXG9_9BILA
MPANVTPFSIKLPCALRLQKTFLNLSTGISTPGTFSWSSARMKKFDTCTEENKSMSFQMGARLNYRLFNFALEKIGVRFFVDLSHDNGLFEQNGVSDGGDYQYDVYSLMKAAAQTNVLWMGYAAKKLFNNRFFKGKRKEAIEELFQTLKTNLKRFTICLPILIFCPCFLKQRHSNQRPTGRRSRKSPINASSSKERH